jgi:hypothetical protein
MPKNSFAQKVTNPDRFNILWNSPVPRESRRKNC